MRFKSSMKACASARLADPARASTARRSITVGAALAHDAARPAGDLRHHVGAESLHDLVERALHGGERGQMFDHAVAPFHRLAALHRLAVAQNRPRRQVAVLVGERLEQLGREAMFKV